MDQKEQDIVLSECRYRRNRSIVRNGANKGGTPLSGWEYNRTKGIFEVGKKKLVGWQNHRKTALPPYSDKEIQYYKEKLIKFKLVYPDILDPKHEYYWEAKHCQEVLDSHQRLLDMEHKNNNELHDDQNPPSICPSDKKC